LWNTRSAASQPAAAVLATAAVAAGAGAVLSLQAVANRLKVKAMSNEGRAAIMAMDSGSGDLGKRRRAV
jgi:hypothetical protein